jgi:cobalt/nickel transport system ATP-binding protein
MGHMNNLVQLEKIRFSHDNTRILDGLDFRLEQGEKLGLAGSIGAGKTTLLHLVVGLLKPQKGRISVFGIERSKEEDFREVRRKVGLVFQNPDDQLFCPTVLEDVAFGPLNLGYSVEEARTVAEETLARVGLAGFGNRITYRLSGGEKRLVALASVLSMTPEVLLLDEPQNGLDPAAYERVRKLLISLPQAMVVVSHDREFLEAVTSKCLRLEQGTIQS